MKIGMVSLGCPKNLVDSEVMLGLAQREGHQLTREAAEDVFRTLATEKRADRIHNPGLEEARADVIVAGCCALVAIMRHFGLESIVHSEADILDGLALSVVSGTWSPQQR